MTHLIWRYSTKRESISRNPTQLIKLNINNRIFFIQSMLSVEFQLGRIELISIEKGKRGTSLFKKPWVERDVNLIVALHAKKDFQRAISYKPSSNEILNLMRFKLKIQTKSHMNRHKTLIDTAYDIISTKYWIQTYPETNIVTLTLDLTWLLQFFFFQNYNSYVLLLS